MPNRAMQSKALKLIKQKSRAPHPVFPVRNTVGSYDLGNVEAVRCAAVVSKPRLSTHGDGTRLNAAGYLAGAIAYEPHAQWEIVRR